MTLIDQIIKLQQEEKIVLHNGPNVIAQGNVIRSLITTDFGAMLITGNDKGLQGLHFVSDEEMEELRSLGVHNKNPFNELPLDSEGKLNLYVKGTPYQFKVWSALLTIPAGSTFTYKQVAELCDNPAAVRATGTAIGQNELSVIVPCHRVILSSGEIGQFRWTPQVKQSLLDYEKKYKIA